MQSDTRRIFRDNLLALMRSREIPNPYQLALYLKGRGVPVSQRTVAYALDEDGDRYANLSTVEAVAAGFGLEPWQLLVPNMMATSPPKLAALRVADEPTAASATKPPKTRARTETAS